MNLPTNSTDRILAVANTIETHPKAWNQGIWALAASLFDILGTNTPENVDELNEWGECTTQCCVSGWGVRFTPRDDEGMQQIITDWQARQGSWTTGGPERLWHDAGKYALGLEEDMANALFYSSWSEDETVEMLWTLAEIPEGSRNIESVISALGKPAESLLKDWIEVDD